MIDSNAEYESDDCNDENDKSNMKGNRIALHNCQLNIQALSEEFCLHYEPCSEMSSKDKQVFIVRGLKENREEFLKAITKRVEILEHS